MQSVNPHVQGHTAVQEGPETPVADLWRRWRQNQCPDFGDTLAGEGLGTDQALSVLRYDQLQRWQSGERVPAEQYLSNYSILKSDPEQGIVLVYGEYLLRQELGEAPTLDEYLQRFPQYAVRLRQQDDFHRALTAISLSSPIVPSSPLAAPEQAGHCRIVGEIARGGMGIVLKGHDERLGRDLAVKLLRDEHREHPGVVRRFLDEAQVSGQLQHPGVVPVHEVGRVADGRPFFTMKLVRGRTLATLLAERSQSPTGGRQPPDLPRFLKIFEQVCQTVAYAHSRGVIHRDLKPANVMVGAFGEVQVMDWGLAKVLDQKSREPQSRAREQAEDAVRPIRNESLGGTTVAGAVVGTPAYMSPEQARGDIVDERCDVFGLGALLCEILTGQPPYATVLKDQVLLRARQADLNSALASLDGCGADADLLHLAKDCLAPKADDRPRDGSVVAEAVTAYLASVQERLRTAEIERAAARAKAEEARATATAERRARRMTVGLALAVLGLALAGGLGWWLVERKNIEAVRGIEGALQESARLQGQEQWPAALAVVERANAQSTTSIPAELRQRVHDRRSDLGMVVDLEEIRLQMFDHPQDAVRACAVAFQKYGIDVQVLDPAAAAESIQQRAIRDQLTAALDDWALVERDTSRQERLLAIARAADPEPWRDALRSAILQKDGPALKKLAESDGLAAQPARGPVLLGKALAQLLRASGDAGAVRVLRNAHRQYPGDVWVNHLLAGTLDDQKPSQLTEALRYYTATVALRPRSPYARMNLGYALERTGALDEAIAVYEKSLWLKSDFALARMNLGNALQRKGQIDRAIEQFQESIRLDGTDPLAHYNLGNAFMRNDQPDEAIAAYREALRLNKNFAEAWSNLGMALGDIGERDEAIAAYRTALSIDKTDVFAINNLGRALQHKGLLDEAVAAFRQALEIKPDYAMAHCNLGLALQSQGKFAQALDALKRGHEIGSKDPRWKRPSAAWITHCERLIALESRLPAVVIGTDEPAEKDRDDFVELCLIHKYPATAVRLFAAAFTAQPALAEDLQTGRRYNAACAAALASHGQSRDDPPLDDAAKAHFRKQALDWLRADLSLWAESLASNPAQRRLLVRATLRHWQQDADLAGVRDAVALAKLSADEQETCRKLWAEVDALLAKARTAKSAGPP